MGLRPSVAERQPLSVVVEHLGDCWSRRVDLRGGTQTDRRDLRVRSQRRLFRHRIPIRILVHSHDAAPTNGGTSVRKGSEGELRVRQSTLVDATLRHRLLVVLLVVGRDPADADWALRRICPERPLQRRGNARVDVDNSGVVRE